MALATAGVYGLLSPDFGLNRASLALFLGLAASIVVVTVTSELVMGWYIRLRGGRGVHLRVFAPTLLIAGASVAISRLADFQPGYMYGVVAAVALRGTIAKALHGKAVVAASLATLAVGAGAWFLLIPVKDAATADAGLGLLVLEAGLAATFVAALEGLLVGLLPLRFLDGQRLWAWSRAAWVAVFAVAMFGFVHVLLNPASEYVRLSDSIPTATVVGLFVGFALFSVLFWARFRFRRAKARG